MRVESSSIMPSRRGLLLLVGAGLAALGRAYGFAADFWNKKLPAEWNAEEIGKLLTKSPWAKEVLAQRSTSNRNAGVPMDGTGMPGASTGTRSTAGLGGRTKMPGSGTKKAPSTKTVTIYKGTVVWESAKPIQEALKTPLPDEFAGQYVLSVSGIQLVKPKEDGDTTASRSALEKLKGVTRLEPKGGSIVQPATVRQQTENGSVYLFGFPKESLPLTRDDKDVTFTTSMGKLVFTAKFNPKEMLYRGELAV